MKGKGLEIRRVPCSPIGEIWNARVDDWIDDGMRLVELAKEHAERYREKICPKCTPERQAERKCTALKERCDTKSCGHMDRACAAKFRHMISAHEEAHPFRQRLRMNAELERRRREREGLGTYHPDLNTW